MARAQAHERLDDLIALVGPVRPRVEEGQQAGAPVGLGDAQEERAGRADREQGRERPHPRAGGEQQPEGDARQHQRGPHVGLLHHQQTGDEEDNDQGADSPRPLPGPSRPTGEQVGSEQHQGQFHELGGLDPERARPDPAARPVDEHPYPRDQHQDEEHEGETDHRAAEPLPDSVVELGAHDQYRDTHGHPQDLALEVHPGRSELAYRLDRRRREHHHQAHHGEHADDGHQADERP